jgi:hypothetical protein
MVKGDYLCWMDGISGEEDRGRGWGGEGGPDLEQRGDGFIEVRDGWQSRLERGHGELE